MCELVNRTVENLANYIDDFDKFISTIHKLPSMNGIKFGHYIDNMKGNESTGLWLRPIVEIISRSGRLGELNDELAKKYSIVINKINDTFIIVSCLTPC